MNQTFYRGEILKRILSKEEQENIEQRYQAAKHYTGNSRNVIENFSKTANHINLIITVIGFWLLALTVIVLLKLSF